MFHFSANSISLSFTIDHSDTSANELNKDLKIISE